MSLVQIDVPAPQLRSRLGDLATPARTVPADALCPAVERGFHQHPEVACVVVLGDCAPHLLTRQRFMMEMAGPIGYGRALHANTPVLEVAERAPTLTLEATLEIEEAGRLALARESPWRYDDIVVEELDGGLAIVTVADLFSQLAAVNERRSLHDALTGLANRSGFSRAVGEALRAGTRVHDGGAAVLFVDLDNFKTINDSLGHEAGDELLAQLAMRMRNAFREEDVIARLGGDEFAILLCGATRSSAERAAGRLVSLTATPLLVGEQEVQVSMSIGIALQEHPDEPVGNLLRNADLAMYESKRTGKGRSAFYRRQLHHQAVTRLDLRTDLGHALERDELHLHYQPIVDLADRRIVGVEALLRWEHPRRGPVAPLEFLPIAEESGAISSIGGWVLAESCRQAVAWQGMATGEPPLGLAVNVSVRQLEIPTFPDDVARALAETGLPARSLTLEITESALAHEPDAVSRALHAIRRSGVRIAIDDFGTGYSSFARLEALPVQQIKVDKSFTARLTSARASSVMQGLLALAGVMDLEAIVEGVENEGQARILRGLGCSRAQGYLFSKPCPAPAITQRLG